MRPACAFVLAIGVVSATPVAAQELPRFDVKAHCHEVASFGGTYSALTERGCFDLEQSSYDSLKREWADLPASVKRECISVASFGGGDYMTLRGCVDLEIDAMNTNRGSQFRY